MKLSKQKKMRIKKYMECIFFDADPSSCWEYSDGEPVYKDAILFIKFAKQLFLEIGFTEEKIKEACGEV